MCCRSAMYYVISIHAAREGGDLILCSSFFAKKEFQSTPPVKAATPTNAIAYTAYKISIHAAREGGDDTKIDRFGVLSNFNPRRP